MLCHCVLVCTVTDAAADDGAPLLLQKNSEQLPWMERRADGGGGAHRKNVENHKMSNICESLRAYFCVRRQCRPNDRTALGRRSTLALPVAGTIVRRPWRYPITSTPTSSRVVASLTYNLAGDELNSFNFRIRFLSRPVECMPAHIQLNVQHLTSPRFSHGRNSVGCGTRSMFVRVQRCSLLHVDGSVSSSQ